MLRLFVGPLNSFSIFFPPLSGEKSTQTLVEECRQSVREREWLKHQIDFAKKSPCMKLRSSKRDENQYLIMQLSIRKLLSARRSPNGSHFAQANKAVNWHSRLLLFDLWTENNHPLLASNPSKSWNKWTRKQASHILIYGVHMRIALSPEIIKSEGNWWASWKRNGIQLQEWIRATHIDPMYTTSGTYLHIIAESIQYQSPLKELSRPLTSIARWFRSIDCSPSTSHNIRKCSRKKRRNATLPYDVLMQ